MQYQASVGQKPPGAFSWSRNLAQSREAISSRTAALDWPQEREQAAAWANVRARSGCVKQLPVARLTIKHDRIVERRKSDIAEATDGSDGQSHERLAHPC